MIPPTQQDADDAICPRRSTLALYEDGLPLLSPHSPPEAIQRYGWGRYAHCRERVLFATSDNSDPNTNRRVYSWSASPWLYRRRVAPWQDGGLPANHRRRRARPEQIRQDVSYTLRVGERFLEALRAEMPSLHGKNVLEIGPGTNDGSVLFLAAFGARPFVLDRFLAPWDQAYHPDFYTLLREEIGNRYPDADTRPLSALLDAGGYPDEVITRYEAALEENHVPPESIDVVFSNAVVEHLYEPTTAFAALHHMTRPGGIGLHQVDFRDHRDFDRPLKFLLLGEDEFRTVFERSHGETGNRLRPQETAHALDATGFAVTAFEANAFADDKYLARFVPRLRAAKGSRYRNYDAADLRVLGGFYHVRKEDDA